MCTNKPTCKVLVKCCLAGGVEQVDLVAGNLFHSLDAGGIDRVRLAQDRVSQHLAALPIESVLDVAGDIDLVDAELDRGGDLGIRVGGAAVQDKRNSHAGADFLQQVEF